MDDLIHAEDESTPTPELTPALPDVNPAHLQREGIIPAGDQVLRQINKATSPRDIDGREQSWDVTKN